MLVDEKNSFLTQRQMPQLARIGLTFVEDSHIELSLNGNLVADFGLLEKEAAALTVRIWKDDVAAHEGLRRSSEGFVRGFAKMSRASRSLVRRESAPGVNSPATSPCLSCLKPQ